MDTLSLFNFEDVIDTTIIKRGCQYFTKNQVVEFSEEDGHFSALVEGSDTYETDLQIEDKNIISMHCTCPYDLGPVCKHEVALIYAVNAYLKRDGHDAFSDSETILPKKSRKKRPKKPTIEEIVKGMDRSQLESLIIDHANHHREFYGIVERMAPIDETQKDLKNIYKSLIRNCIRAAGDRHGFVDYGNAHQAAQAADELAIKADDLLKNKKFDHASQIYQALVEEVYVGIEHVDDSDGNFNCAIDSIWKGFQIIADSVPIESPLARKLFNYFLDEAEKEKYKGWLLNDDFLALAGLLVRNDSDKNILFEKLDHYEQGIKAEKDKEWRRLDLEKSVQIKIKTLLRLQDEQAAQHLIDQHINYPSIRKDVILTCISQGNLDRAKQLAKEGIKLALTDRYLGSLKDFEEMLLEISEKEQDIPTIRQYLAKFFCARRDFEKYNQLKQTYSSEEWQNQFPEIIKKVGGNSDAALDIYLKENKRDLFFETVKLKCIQSENGGLYTLDRYHQELTANFREALLLLYVSALKKTLPNLNDRRKYQDFCQYLRRMKKIGGHAEVEELKAYCREQYRNRTALHDELIRV